MKTCSNCQFYRESWVPEGQEPRGDGECRFNPPTFKSVEHKNVIKMFSHDEEMTYNDKIRLATTFELVLADEWCGQHKSAL